MYIQSILFISCQRAGQSMSSPRSASWAFYTHSRVGNGGEETWRGRWKRASITLRTFAVLCASAPGTRCCLFSRPAKVILLKYSDRNIPIQIPLSGQIPLSHSSWEDSWVFQTTSSAFTFMLFQPHWVSLQRFVNSRHNLTSSLPGLFPLLETLIPQVCTGCLHHLWKFLKCHFLSYAMTFLFKIPIPPFPLCASIIFSALFFP